jgi:hypothetical protein
MGFCGVYLDSAGPVTANRGAPFTIIQDPREKKTPGSGVGEAPGIMVGTLNPAAYPPVTAPSLLAPNQLLRIQHPTPWDFAGFCSCRFASFP